MSDPNSFAWTKNDLPYNWDPYRAMPFVEVIRFIDRYLRPDLPIYRQHLLVIFFHETGFCNVRQNQGKGPAVGFGQMEIYNPDKIPYFQTINHNSAILNPKLSAREKEKYSYLNNLVPLTYESVLNDSEFAIKMHCKYFAWLFDEGYSTNAAPGEKGIKSLRGMLSAQTGGGKNAIFVDHFINAGTALQAVINSGDRGKIIDALNSVRTYYKQDSTETEKQPLTITRYKKYWDYIMPEEDIKFGVGK